MDEQYFEEIKSVIFDCYNENATSKDFSNDLLDLIYSVMRKRPDFNWLDVECIILELVKLRQLNITSNNIIVKSDIQDEERWDNNYE